MEEALKMIDEEIEKSRETLLIADDACAERLLQYVYGLRKARDIIIAEHKTNGWIPVSERLPDDTDYLKLYATLRCKESGRKHSARLRWAYDGFENLNGSQVSQDFEVVAWIEDKLPEPYNG